MTGIDRDALIDAAGRALFQRLRPDPDWPDWDVAEDRVRDIHRDWAAQVVDAVLPLIADAIDARVDSLAANDSAEVRLINGGLSLAANQVRSFQDGGNPDA